MSQPPRPRPLDADAQSPSTTTAEGDLLLGLFSGKRQDARRSCHVPAVLEGARGPMAATALDLSEGGALVQIDDPAFVAVDRQGGLRAYLELLEVHAQTGLALVFPEQQLRLPAQIVRWTAGGGGEASRVGLRFERPLTAMELDALRSGAPLPQGTPAAASAARPAPTHAPRRDARLQALVFLALKPELGPLLAARATAFGAEHAVLHVSADLDVADLRARLASGALFVSLIEGPRVLHESTARLLDLAPSAQGAGHDLVLAPRAPWPAPLWKRLRRA